MAQPVSVSRAARLVGVPRAVLQAMVSRGELAAFDGMIDVTDLLRRFPRTEIENTGAFEKVARIRDEAFGRRVLERSLPPREILAQRLFGLGQELADTRRHLSAYHELVIDLIERIQPKAAHDDDARDWYERLEAGLARILAAEDETTFDAMTEMLKVVSASVTVKPGGQQFLVEGNDSILQAGLKAGLGFNYGCGSGNCGLCRARVISGEVRQLRHSDYPMSAAERQQGHILMCTNTAVSDLVVEGLVARGPADIPEQEIVARVKDIGNLGSDTLQLHLQTPRSARLRFLAGQFVTLGVAVGDDDAVATYPVASCPCDERNLLFHVARDPADPFASRLFEGGLEAGDGVNVRGPIGDFVLDADSERSPVFLACDTGFAPIRGLIEHAISIDDSQSMSLYWLGTRTDGHYLDNQCRAWAAALDEFNYVPVDGADPVADGGRLASAACDTLAPGQADFYVAGPAPFVAAVTERLAELGMDTARLRCTRV